MENNKVTTNNSAMNTKSNWQKCLIRVEMVNSNTIKNWKK
jgi:hypothetical protein